MATETPPTPADQSEDNSKIELSIATDGSTVSNSTINIGDVVGRDKIVQGDEVRGDKIDGDKYTAEIGAGVQNVQVGSNNSTSQTTITNHIGGNTIFGVLAITIVGTIAALAIVLPYVKPLTNAIGTGLSTALVILIGTTVVYLQWNRRQATPTNSEFEEIRRVIYKEIWERAENLSIQIRLEQVLTGELSNEVKKLNVFMLKNGVYLDSDTKLLVNQYVKAVDEFQRVIKSSDNEDAKVAFGETEEIPESVLIAARDIRVAQENALSLRTKLVGKIQLILAGKKYR